MSLDSHREAPMPSDIDQLRQSVAELRACLLTMPDPQQILSHVPVLAAHVARLEGANIAEIGRAHV